MAKKTQNLLAFDLGAESGRGLIGKFDGKEISLQVLHRFPTGGIATLDTFHWDVLRLYNEMITALRKAGEKPGQLASMGVDTWGVDVAFLGRDGSLLGNPRHYRDPHTENIFERAFQKVSKQEIFRQTGIQFMRFNTLYQILALMRDRSPLIDVAENMLFIPDLFNYWFTGEKVNEYTDASTSQMLDPGRRDWARALTRTFEIPDKMLGTIVMPGTKLGPLRASVARQAGIAPIPVIAPATHDTASAVAAVPAQGNSWAYISSGTWSLMGAEIDAPLLTDEAHAYNFTNEGGVGGTIRLLKNVMGLWLVQECKGVWEREDRCDYGYGQLAREAGDSPGFGSIIDPDDASFILPAHMPDAIADYCVRTGQEAPVGRGAIVRCALESLALRYRWVLDGLEKLLGRRLETIHIVGGGCQNVLLCQLTADACNRRVLAGPIEATALGNVLVQALGLGLLGSLEQAREVVRNSFELYEYLPQGPERWQGPYERFQELLKRN